MCRLDNSAFRGHSIEQFWHLHPEAKARHFGYLFRSPTVWEDMVELFLASSANPRPMGALTSGAGSSALDFLTVSGSLPKVVGVVAMQVKTITICNVRWKQSLLMNHLLCTAVSRPLG